MERNRDVSEKTLVSPTFSGFCQEATRFRLSLIARNRDLPIRVTQPDSKTEICGDWMVVSVAQSSMFRLILKVTYTDRDVDQLARGALGSDGELSIHQINDFMREYGNQCVGALKRAIEDQSGYAKASHPLITHREDFPFFAPNPAVPHFEDRWKLSTDYASIQCSVSLEFLDRSLIRKILLPAFLDTTTIGDVEFFAA
jgi:hypothetical protein